MGAKFTLPPDNRAVGTGSPAQDMNGVVDTLTAMGAAFNVLNTTYAGGADPSGAADSTAAITAALAAATAGQAVILPTGTYQLTSGLTVPADVTLISGIAGVLNPPPAGAVLKPSASFSGTAVLTMSNGSVLSGISIDGSNLPAGSVAGIAGASAVGCVAEYCLIYKASGNGFDVGSGARGWHVSHCKVDTAGGNGVGLSNHTDGTWIDVHVINSTGHGWSIAGSPANSRFIACRAEWSAAGKDGFHLTSAWGTGTGSGGCLFSGCSTDRNDNHGFGITCTGTVPILLSGCEFRRDGRNGGTGGASFAGLSVNNVSCPVIVNGLTVFPGVDDNGTGTNSPQYGLSLQVTNTLVAVTGAYLQGNTAGINGTSGASYRNVWTSSGTTAAPTAATLQADTA